MPNLAFKEKIIFFLLLTFPISLISGPLVPEIIQFVISLIFIFELVKKNNSRFLKNFYFIYFFIFFSYLIIVCLFSDYKNDILIKSFFNFRYLIFVFAAYYFINKNEIVIKWFFYTLTLIFIFLIFDSLYQFHFGQNIFGFPQIRIDRVSSLFNDKLVLGSFISKFFFLYIALYFFLKNKKLLINNFIFVLIIFFLFITIIISGDRSALYLTIIGIFLLLFLLDSNKKFLFILIIIFSSVLILNKNFYDRYVSQTTSQINFLKKNPNQNFFERFKYYSLIWNTNYKAFSDKKIIGHGPKSFRYFCSDKRYEVLSKKKYFVRNDIQTFNVHKKKVNVEIVKIFFKKNDVIKNNDAIFSYLFNNKIIVYKSNTAGKITNIYIAEGDIINPGHQIFDLDLKNLDIPIKTYYHINGCASHPHQIYMQLLSESGLIGFVFISLIFIYICFRLLKSLFFKTFKQKNLHENFEIVLLVNFFIFLFPFTTSGNFFNNWFVMLHLVQISISMFMFNHKKLK